MIFFVTFNSELDNYDEQNDLRLLSIEDQDEYSRFSIDMEVSGVFFKFSSGVMMMDYDEIRDFVYSFVQHEKTSISFNEYSGSSISYDNELNILAFCVYTWKEGTVTDSLIKIRMDSDKHSMFSNVFHKLLLFKNLYDSFIVYEDDVCSCCREENILQEEDQE